MPTGWAWFTATSSPENILFAQGLPIVADFGIAKAISTAGGEQLTRTGFPLGTPGYMSPEQAAGLTDLDVRTDVYGLAVVCYEMLVGATPGRWPTEDAVRSGRFLDAPASHRAALDRVPPAFEPALVRAMAIRHDQRTPSAEAFVAELTADLRPAPQVEPAKRRYSEGEVQEIVKRASEMEVSQPTMGGSLTIGGIQQVAAEAGIDPALVRQAAGRLGTHDSTAQPTSVSRSFGEVVIGGPTRLVYERRVSGGSARRRIPAAHRRGARDDRRQWHRRHAGPVGHLGLGAERWGIGDGTRRQVTIARTRRGHADHHPRRAGGVDRRHLRWHRWRPWRGRAGPDDGHNHGRAPRAAALIVVLPLWITTVYATARSVYYHSAKRRMRELEGLADRLADLAAQVAIPQAALPPSPPAGRLGPG